MKVSLRFNVFKRDAFVCQYCGRTPPAVVLEVDHVQPRSKGGTDAIDNLLTSCWDCNRGKGSASLEQIPPALADKAAILRERTKQLRAYNALLADIAASSEVDVGVVEAALQEFYDDTSLTPNGRTSVRRFLDDLPVVVVADAMRKACARTSTTRDAFKYFCGICWRKIKDGRD